MNTKLRHQLHRVYYVHLFYEKKISNFCIGRKKSQKHTPAISALMKLGTIRYIDIKDRNIDFLLINTRRVWTELSLFTR